MGKRHIKPLTSLGSSCSFRCSSRDIPGKVDFACFGRREGTGDVLEGSVLGLRDKEDDEQQKEDQQPHEHQERVLLEHNLNNAK